jgi:putative peptide zinc metalloprotease protein
MFVSSVSTIMFNANPLLRYDGYYILSDILEIPNLRQKAGTILNRKLGKWCLGLEEPEDPFLPKRHQALFAMYTVASAIYRWIVLFGILYFLNKVFEPYGLKILGQALAIASVWGLIFMPVRAVWKFFRVPGRLSKVKRPRLYATLTVLATVVAAIFFVPLPSRVWAWFELQPYDAESVYVEADGVLRKVHVKAGDHVKKGQLLAELENLNLVLEVEQLRAQCESLEAQITNLERLRVDPRRASEASLNITKAQEDLAGYRRELAKKEQDIEQLRLVAPRAGTVIPPPRVPDRSADNPAELHGWSGTPLDPENIGCTLTADSQQNLFCQIGDPDHWEAVLVIDQDDVSLVRDGGQKVRLMFDESAYHVYVSQLERPADDAMQYAPPRLASTNGGPLPAKAEPDGTVKPLSTSYQAVAPLDNSTGLLRNGLIGRARIETAPRTIWQRFYRYVSRTFNFDL